MFIPWIKGLLGLLTLWLFVCVWWSDWEEKGKVEDGKEVSSIVGLYGLLFIYSLPGVSLLFILRPGAWVRTKEVWYNAIFKAFIYFQDVFVSLWLLSL